MLELLIAFLLIVLNGLFALSELAIVSSRASRLRVMAERGQRGAEAALALSEEPGRFLPTVQIGITLIGILAGAVSGAALGGRVSEILSGFGFSRQMSDALGYGGVVAVITFMSVVIGELVPKQFALRHPEPIACVMAPPMAALSKAAAPLVWFLNVTTRALMWLLGARDDGGSSITDDEIRTIVAEARTAGVIEPAEHRMIGGVLRLGDRSVRGLMTPRMEVDWINVDDDDAAIYAQIAESPHSRFPVIEGDADNVIGVVVARDLLRGLRAGAPLDIRSHVRAAPVAPDTLSALDVLEALQKSAVPMALVYDEYGHFEGVVTPADALEAIVGAFISDEPDDEDAVQRQDGSWLLSGSMYVDELGDLLGLDLPEERDYDTVAGLVIDAMRRLPQTGEAVEALGWRFEVIDMDGRRVDKVLASKV
ncbi:DNA-binding protein [Camelimonas fluminis]|uniref:Hemolysin family protein n=1 Tax=Camelimonas fluminis TaxID=1576911 RepID=A0ABV7UCU3_9HYPH|nr:hemolysin family protein [Camelimonas fluminis]GHE47103.1 DNA-binding protein [Camelimonas fluminis]